MPSRHLVAVPSRVTSAPPKAIVPACGARSPAIRPNRLVLPAPFGPTMPTMSPAPMRRDRLSATMTLPKLLVTPLSSSRAVPAASGIRWHQVSLDLHRRVQAVVHDLHHERVLAGGRLPLHADRREDSHAGRRAPGEVDRAAHAGVADRVQGGGNLALVVRIADVAERFLGDLEKAVARPDRLGPLIARCRLVGGGQRAC